MILPKPIVELASADTIQELLLQGEQNKMKIKIEQEDHEPVKPVGDESDGELPVLMFSNLTLHERVAPEDDSLTSRKDEANVKAGKLSNDDEELDPSKLVCKGPMKSKTMSSRTQCDPYTYTPQPSLAQTTIINGRQMTGSQVSETIWFETPEHEIPATVAEISELQTPLSTFENLQQPCVSDPLINFTSEDVDKILNCISNLMPDSEPRMNVMDEGFNDVYDWTETYSGLQPNVSEGLSEVQPTNFNGVPGSSIETSRATTRFNGYESNLRDSFSGDSSSGETNLAEGVPNEDPYSPDSAYGSIGVMESPRNSPKSDFYALQGLSPRNQFERDGACNVYQQHGNQMNVNRRYLQGCEDEAQKWSLDFLTPQLPQVTLNIPAEEVPSPKSYVDLSDMSCPQNIPAYNIPSNEGNACPLNIPSRAIDEGTPQIPCSSPRNINVPESRTEKKKTNQRISQSKKNPPPLQTSGSCNSKPLNRKMTDRSPKERLKAMMTEYRKEVSWKATIFKTLEEFCMKNEQGQTSLMIPLLLERTVQIPIVETVFTILGRIKRDKLPDLLCHRDNNGHCALYQAATLYPDIPEIAAYIAETYASLGCDVNRPYKNGNTILHYLAELGDNFDQVLDELLKVSVNGERIFRIDQRNDDGNTPLHVAAEHHLASCTGSTYSIASTLIKHRGSVCVQNYVGATPLHVAAKSKSCQPQYFKKLLEQRGAENIQDENGNTPLHLVALSVNVHNVEILKKVIDHLRTSNARADLKNKAGMCPLDNVHQLCREAIRNVIHQKRQ